MFYSFNISYFVDFINIFKPKFAYFETSRLSMITFESLSSPTNQSIISQIQISPSDLIVVSYELFTKYILAIVMKIYKNIKNIGYFFK